MARQIKCVCGRTFYVGHSKGSIQCRNCGRLWDAKVLNPIQAVMTLLKGGEVASANYKKGDRKSSKKSSYKKKQTNKKRPAMNPFGSAIKWFFR